MPTSNYKRQTDKQSNAEYNLQHLHCPWTKVLIRTTHATFPRGHILLTGGERNPLNFHIL
jgi:hypothetical protein